MKLNILGDEEIKKANSDYEWTTTDDFSTNYDEEKELKRWKAIAKAQAKMTAKQIMSDLDRLSVEHKDDTDFLASVGQYLKELQEGN